MRKVNLAIDILNKNYTVPSKKDLEDEEVVDSLILRSDCDSIDEFIDIHKNMENKENKECKPG